MKHWLLFIVLLGISLSTFAQSISSFSTEPDAFMKELVDYMKSTKRDDDKEVVEKFEELVKNGQINGTQLTSIITTSNYMLKQKFRANPHFHDYLATLNTFADKGVAQGVFASWTSVLDSVILNTRRGSSKEFTAFMDFSNGLFTDNVIYFTKQKQWRPTSKDYVLSYVDGEPLISFNSTNLVGKSANDSTTVQNTSGKYYPLTATWKGDKGKIDWSRVKLDPQKVYAQFDAYEIEFDKPEFTIDSVIFQDSDFFTYALRGQLTEKLTSQFADGFPRFVSYRTDLPIDDLGPNIKYIGGFSLQGDQIVGTDGPGGKARIDMYDDGGRKVMTVRSNNIILRESDDLSAQNAEVSIYLGEDSIYHPGLTVKYRVERRELSLYTGEGGVSASAFFDSYHNMEIRAEAIIWKMDENKLEIKMMSGAGKNPVDVASENFFRPGELDKYAVGMDFNPISVIKMYSERNRTREIYADMLAKAMNPNYTENTIKRLLYKLVEDGFIYYDENTGIVTVKDKVFTYVFANADMRDYDNLRFYSFSGKDNGELNLDDYTINFEGVKQITLSDTSAVYIFPGDSDITLYKNQDIKFSNVVIAGIIDFIGTGFYFDYDSFMVDLTDLASATINVPTGEYDEDNDPIYVPLKSKIEGLTGYLVIDSTNNKSGKESHPEFPIFTNREISYVYYDFIRDSCYIRDKFYFELDPFTIDSLITYDPYTSDLQGRLISADIFPTFDEHLEIQPDLSLGFQKMTPDAGYDIYKGKGHYNDSILLSNNGLLGRGHVEYLFTAFNSNDILFTPDSLNAITDSFNMDETTYNGHSYPMVEGYDNDIHWLPYADSMFIKMRTVPFLMYADKSSMKGNLILTPEGLQGDGSFEFNEAVLTSTQFNFEANSLSSDTMGMQIKSLDEDRVTFNTPNVSGNVDFEKRIGSFKSNVTDIATEFTNNYYKTEINEFFWDMDANILDFKAPPGSEGSYFTSTRGDQDSLKFLGTRAYFNMSTSIIDVTGVPEVLVADARIIPDSGKVVIQPGGLLDTLNNAVVYADTASQAFKLYNAQLVIQGKKGYTGSGVLDYVYENTPAQPVLFTNIAMEKEEDRKKTYYHTTASTTVADTAGFKLNDGFGFSGKIGLKALEPFLTFNGLASLSQIDPALLDSSGKVPTFSVENEVNPDTVLLHYDTPKNADKDDVSVGLYFDPLDTMSYYVNLMQPKHNPDDITSLEFKGIAKYDSKAQTYYFGDEDRLLHGALTGNTLTYNVPEKTMHMEGPMNMNVDLNPIKLLTAGSVDYWIDSSKFMFNTMVGIDLPIADELITQLGTDVLGFTFDRPVADYTTDNFKTALAQVFGEKKAKKGMETALAGGQFVKPKELDYNIVISNVQLYYDAYYQIYRSIGPITISYIGDQVISKQVTGYLVFGMRKNHDFMDLYLESNFNDWYYLSYNDLTLQMVSSKEDFNKMLASIDQSKRQLKVQGEEEFFFYTISTYASMQSFLQRMNMIESGERVEFQEETDQEDLEMELDRIRQELLDAEQEQRDNADDNDNGNMQPPKQKQQPSVDPRDMFDEGPPPDDNAPAENNKPVTEPEPTPPPQQEDVQPTPQPDQKPPMLQEIEDYDNGGGKKKKKKGEPDVEDVTPTPTPEPDVQPDEDNGKKKKKDEPEQQDVTPTPTPEPTPEPDTQTEEDNGKKKKKDKTDEEPDVEDVTPTPTPSVEPTPTPESEPKADQSEGENDSNADAGGEEDNSDTGGKKKKKKGDENP